MPDEPSQDSNLHNIEEKVALIRDNRKRGGHGYIVAVKECAALIELALKELIRRHLHQISETAYLKFQEEERKIGEGKRTYRNFTMGQLVGLIRTSKFLDALSDAIGMNLTAIRTINLDQIVEIRNAATHTGPDYQANAEQADILWAALKAFLVTLGIMVLDEHEPPLPPGKPTDAHKKKQKEGEAIGVQMEPRLHRPDYVGSAPVLTEADRANRRTMLNIVRRNWIEGVLHKSIWNEARLILNLEGRPDAVVHPCDLALRRAGQSDTPIPLGTPILDVYRQEQEELLLLGEPGSGKTTLLLEIAETLLQEAENDPTLPIPVVFNLSAWRKNHDRLDTWLVEQLNQDYLIPPKIGKRWVVSGTLLLLLDGLDEVAESRRAVCVDAINVYRHQHQAVLRPMVVCCRTKEYETIPNLQLSGAVVVQPLTKEQVDGYLRGGGKALAGLRAVLKDEPTLYRELFSTPLMLHVAVVTYKDETAADLRRSVPIEERRRRLWDAYIERAFERKQEQTPLYDKAQALDWLAWLGQYLTRKDLQKYLIEGMQPDDLPRWQTFLVRWLLVLCFASPFLLEIRLIPIFELATIILVCASAGYRRDIRVEPKRRLSLRGVWHRWKWWPSRVVIGMAWGMAVGAATLPSLLNNGGAPFVVNMVAGASMGAIVGALVKAVWIAVMALFEESILEDTVRSNEGIHHSVRTSVSGMIVGSLVLGAVGGVAGRAGSVAFEEAFFGVVVGVAIGVIFFGGIPVFQHYLLRLLLSRSKRFPFSITPFLDWTTQRALVQRVGGGWRFVHRTLQERFAERYDTKFPDTRAQASPAAERQHAVRRTDEGEAVARGEQAG